MTTKTSVRRAPAAVSSKNGKRTPAPEVWQRRDDAASIVAALGRAKFARMTAPEMLDWLKANNRVGYGNLIRALFEITA